MNQITHTQKVGQSRSLSFSVTQTRGSQRLSTRATARNASARPPARWSST